MLLNAFRMGDGGRDYMNYPRVLNEKQQHIWLVWVQTGKKIKSAISKLLNYYKRYLRLF